MPAAHFFAESLEEVGLDPDKVQALFDRAEREVKAGLLPASQVAIARNGILWPSLQNRRKRGLVLLLQTDGRPLPCPPITCSCSYLLWLFSFFPW